MKDLNICFRLLSLILLITSLFCPLSLLSQDTTAIWFPYLEYKIPNPTHSDNPFDLIAEVEFTHEESGTVIVTEMFYIDNSEWCFRFTGTKLGRWDYVSNSSDADLDGLTGFIIVTENSDPVAKGFLGYNTTKFVIPFGNQGDTLAYIFNVYMNLDDYDARGDSLIKYGTNSGLLEQYLDEVEENGFEIAFFHPAEPQVWTTGSSGDTEPNLSLFTSLDSILIKCYERKIRAHIWMWGDDDRSWSPSRFTGGINGSVDQRLQRYIAARLGPLVGWTMGYGFDLEEWASESQLETWASFLNDKFGWQHLIWGRGRFASSLSARAYSNLHPYWYPSTITDIISDIERDTTRPHLYEERYSYGRWDKDMDDTRMTLWKCALAGGMGNFWGHYWGPISSGYLPPPYPNKEQLRTHYQFWHEKNRFKLNMNPRNSITDGIALVSDDNLHYIVYGEDIDSLTIDLSEMPHSQSAIAVDTKLEYAEIELGLFTNSNFVWNAPYQSDWAIAIGIFPLLDQGLPVDLINQSAEYRNGHVELNWQTESELENLGFEIYKSLQNDDSYSKISDWNINPELKGQGNSSSRTDYNYLDYDVNENDELWYKLADVSFSGKRTYHSPIKVSAVLPKSIELFQNYPNPFNNSTMFGFIIPSPARISINIYDLLGKKINTIIDNEMYKSGRHQITWDGFDRNNAAVSSGLYFYQMQIGNNSFTKKMLLIK